MIHLLKITSSLAISASLMFTSVQVPLEPTNRVSLDYNGFSATYLTKQATVADFLRERAISIQPGDQINQSLAQKLDKAESIIIKSPKTVTVRADGKEHIIHVYEGTVVSLLNSMDIEVSGQDWINAGLQDPVTDKMVINIQRVQIKDEIQTMAIDHIENQVPSSELAKGKLKVTQLGADGQRTIVTQTIMVDGEEYSQEVVDSYISQLPLNQTTLIGTKEAVKKAEPVKVVRAEEKAPVKKAPAPVVQKTVAPTVKKTVTETADSDRNWKTFSLSFYTNLPSENGGYTITASGKSLRFGMVASNFYPLGKQIYLEGYGTMTVEDRGGSNFNNSYRLDVFIPRKSGESNTTYLNRVNNLGLRSVKGYVK